MSEAMVVNTYRNVPISYDPVKKQFSARIGSRDIKKPSQSAVEKVILQYQGGAEKLRVMHIHDGWWGMKVEELNAIGVRGSKVLYRRAGRDEVDSEDSAEVYIFDEELFKQAKEMLKEREAFNVRMGKLIGKMKKVDIKDLK